MHVCRSVVYAKTLSSASIQVRFFSAGKIFLKCKNTTFVLESLVPLFQVDQKALQILSFPLWS